MDPETHCWFWTGSKVTGSDGKLWYGRLKYKYKDYRAHRIAAWLYKGFYLNSQLCICHHCDNSMCVNPEHLFIGTSIENVQDMDKKGRRNPCKGEKCNFSKLQERDIVAIRASYQKGISAKYLASLYKINYNYIFAILSRKVWKHIPEESVG